MRRQAFPRWVSENHVSNFLLGYETKEEVLRNMVSWTRVVLLWLGHLLHIV